MESYGVPLGLSSPRRGQISRTIVRIASLKVRMGYVGGVFHRASPYGDVSRPFGTR